MTAHQATNSDPLPYHTGNAGTRGDGVHSHSEIVKEDAFLGLDTVSSTRGQVNLRFRFAKNKEPRLALEFWETARGVREGF